MFSNLDSKYEHGSKNGIKISFELYLYTEFVSARTRDIA